MAFTSHSRVAPRLKMSRAIGFTKYSATICARENAAGSRGGGSVSTVQTITQTFHFVGVQPESTETWDHIACTIVCIRHEILADADGHIIKHHVLHMVRLPQHYIAALNYVALYFELATACGRAVCRPTHYFQDAILA